MPPEPLILGFDTSAAHCAAALLCGDRLLAARDEQMARGQAERLMPLLEEVLAEGGVTWDDLGAIGVGIGPGNFTGIRIAVSAARGLSLALRIPAVGVSLTEAMALDAGRPVLCSIDAPRAHVYLQQFTASGAGPVRICPLEQIGDEFRQEGLVCIGQHAADIARRLGARHAAAVHEPAVAIARLTLQRHGDTSDRPAPLYVRGADAAPAAAAAPVILP